MQIAHDAELHFCPQVDAEWEIRSPEGVADHQISSLARWTELRYLSASPSSEVRNTFSRAFRRRTATGRHRVRKPSLVGRVWSSPRSAGGSPRIDRSRDLGSSLFSGRNTPGARTDREFSRSSVIG